MFIDLDVEKAEATLPTDKDHILSSIKEDLSLEDMNHALKVRSGFAEWFDQNRQLILASVL